MDRRHPRSSSSRSNNSVEHEPLVSVPRYTNSQISTTTVLLPNQMYPENSLMRTHSLGNIKNENQQQTEKGFTQDLDQVSLVSDNRKHSEKKWQETILHSTNADSGLTLVCDLPPLMKRHTPPLVPQPENKNLHHFEQPESHFDTVIIFLFLYKQHNLLF